MVVAVSAALLGIAIALVLGGALVVRRRAPLVAYAGSTTGLAAMAVFVFVGGAYPFVNLASIYAAGQHGERRSWLSLPVAAAGMAVYFTRADEQRLFPLVVFLLWSAGWVRRNAGRASARGGDPPPPRPGACRGRRGAHPPRP